MALNTLNIIKVQEVFMYYGLKLMEPMKAMLYLRGHTCRVEVFIIEKMAIGSSLLKALFPGIIRKIIYDLGMEL